MAEATTGGEDDRSYSGLLSAFPYAFRRSESWLFRTYALVGGLLALGIALLFVLAFVVLVAATTGGPGGTLTVSRAFFVLVGVLVVAPVLAPVLMVARRHRRDSANRRDDALLALSGYLFLGSLYVGLLITVPPEQRATPAGATAPVVAFLYGLPAIAGLLAPLLGAGLIVLVHRATR